MNIYEKEARLLCKSCGEEFPTISFIKNCKKCNKLYRNNTYNVICRRCKKHHVSRPSDPMCTSCYKEVESENARLVNLYYLTEGAEYGKTKM